MVGDTGDRSEVGEKKGPASGRTGLRLADRPCVPRSSARLASACVGCTSVCFRVFPWQLV